MTMNQTERPFCQMMRSDGDGVIWNHETDKLKMSQFGWRCTNSESEYRTDTLIGNWSEERYDLKHLKKHQSLPSQVRFFVFELLIINWRIIQ